RRDEAAPVGLAGDDYRAVIAAGADAGARVQGEAASRLLALLGGVTLQALADQHGADLLLEEGDALRGGGHLLLLDLRPVLLLLLQRRDLAELREAQEAVLVGVEEVEELIDRFRVILEPGGVGEEFGELGARQLAVLVGVGEREELVGILFRLLLRA